MNRNDYLFILRKNLQQLPLDEIDEIISDMNEHFDLGIEAGKTEESICKQLGDPVFLASQYTKEYPRSERQNTYDRRSPSSPNPIYYILKIFLWILAIGPVIAVYASLVAFVAVGFAFIIAGVAFAFAIFVTTMLPISTFAIIAGMFGFIILGLSIIRLSTLGISAFTRFVGKMTKTVSKNLGGLDYA